MVRFRAQVYRCADSAEPDATGHALNKFDLQAGSYEKTETAAVGRALANLGFETKRGLADRPNLQAVPRSALESKAGPKRIAMIDNVKKAGDVYEVTRGSQTYHVKKSGDGVICDCAGFAVEGVDPCPDIVAVREYVLHGRPKLKADVRELIKSLSALGHPDFKKGEGQGARILGHAKQIAKERNWDIEFRTLESINELTDAELSEYAAVLEGEINVRKERLADDGVPA
ncbi:MAG: hypothetical protein L0229_20415 [Blastocatellia bacterium]|nr:hypothetical protein [Blastocatellia bacterium]